MPDLEAGSPVAEPRIAGPAHPMLTMRGDLSTASPPGVLDASPRTAGCDLSEGPAPHGATHGGPPTDRLQRRPGPHCSSARWFPPRVPCSTALRHQVIDVAVGGLLHWCSG